MISFIFLNNHSGSYVDWNQGDKFGSSCSNPTKTKQEVAYIRMGVVETKRRWNRYSFLKIKSAGYVDGSTIWVTEVNTFIKGKDVQMTSHFFNTVL